ILLFSLFSHLPPTSILFPYTTLFRSIRLRSTRPIDKLRNRHATKLMIIHTVNTPLAGLLIKPHRVHLAIKDSPLALFTVDILTRSEEHTSELQSRFDLVCRLLLEKKT